MRILTFEDKQMRRNSRGGLLEPLYESDTDEGEIIRRLSHVTHLQHWRGNLYTFSAIFTLSSNLPSL